MISRETSPLSTSSISTSDSADSKSEHHRRKRRRLSLPSSVIGLFADAHDIGPAVVADAVTVKVHVADNVHIRVLEASVSRQEQLVEQAVRAPPQHSDADPYGVALWPSAQVLAQAVVAYARLRPKGSTLLELGAGCGLASLTAAKLGMHVLATDFRQLPLEFLAKAARQHSLMQNVNMEVFDICDFSSPLPPGEIVVASDLLYDSRVAKALAKRTLEAIERGSNILLSDVGRPGRDAFVAELQNIAPGIAIDFACRGLAVQNVSGGGPESQREVVVEILELPLGGPAKTAVCIGSPCVAVRPADVGSVWVGQLSHAWVELSANLAPMVRFY